MTTKIELLLQEIEAKFNKLNLQLNRQNESNTLLIKELEDVKQKNNSLSNQLLMLNQELSKAELENETLSLKINQLLEKDKSLEIDELVKEIDQCINQIKSNL